MTDPLRVPGSSNPGRAIGAVIAAVVLVVAVLYKVHGLKDLDESVTALTAIGLMGAAVLIELALHFWDKRDWMVLSDHALEMPRYWRGELPLSKIAFVEAVPGQGRRGPMLRLQLKEAVGFDFSRPALCPRRLKRRAGAVVFTRPDLFAQDTAELAAALNQRISTGRSASDAPEVLLGQRPQDAQGSLAGVAVVFGLAMIVTALIHTI